MTIPLKICGEQAEQQECRGLREVADEGDVGPDVFVDLGGVDFDVDLFGFGGVLARLPVTRSSKRMPKASRRSDCWMAWLTQDLAVHAHHAERERVIGGEGAEAEEGAGDGDVAALGEVDDLLRRRTR